jgi:CRP/FNR family cyclic AMP-dependent transcriptional regulator
MEAPVAKLANDGFDPKAFLAKVGTGKTILKFEKNQHVFEQGDVADAVFYIQKGRSSSLSYPSRVRKR